MKTSEKMKLNKCHLSTFVVKMEAGKLTLQEKIEIVLIHGENYHNSRETANIFNNRHNKNIQNSTVFRIVNKFKQSGSVENKYKIPHRKTVTTEENSLNVLLSVNEIPTMPLSERQEEVGISEKSIRRILKKNRYLPYKPKFIHTLQERDLDARIDFCFWFQGKKEDDLHFGKRILFTDEATFTSNGIVSSQNCRWWADQNPHFTIQCKDQYSFKTNVWCGILNTHIVGPYFFRENLNAARYLEFLQNQFSDALDNLPLNLRQNLHFQQDGASIHSTLQVREWLNHQFPNKWIGRFSENPWPARSPDITPMDFFLWGYVKNQVYKYRPFRNLDHLENVIRNCVAGINPAFLRNVASEFDKRTIKCIENEGGHVEM